MDYAIYFLGPLILGAIGARILQQRFPVFATGAIAFLLAWIVMQTIAAVATQSLHLAETSFHYGLIVSALAGLVEESTRYVVFRQLDLFRGNRHGRASTMYAFGHHGMETVIVGLTLLLIVAVLKYKPEAISDPATLRQCRDLVALDPGVKVYNASERLFVGLLLHACFSAVVMLSVVRSDVRWLFVAMAWHFLHNLVGFNLHRLADHWIVAKCWIAIILVVYTYVFVRLWRALPGPPPGVPSVPPGHPPLMLPGRFPAEPHPP